MPGSSEVSNEMKDADSIEAELMEERNKSRALRERVGGLAPLFVGDRSTTPGDDDHPEISNLGQIETMTLPDGWVGGRPYRFSGGVGTRSFHEVHPPEMPKARLCFYYRGLPVYKEAGDIFRDVLDEAPHELSEAEYASLHEVLSDKARAEDFTVAFARTEELNGKNVLVVLGRYKEIEEDTYSILVDASGDGRVIQEIIYQAPAESFREYLSAATDAIKSITWK
jgi:hypothetical protein